jgi:phenylalanyl-tRNA synthetase beta chain
MPVVGIPIQQLRDLVGQDLSNEVITTSCTELGCDVEELTFLNRVKCSNCGSVIEFTQSETIPKTCEQCQHEFNREGSDYKTLPQSEVIRLDLLADRPDNFDAGGLSRSIKGYLGYEKGLVAYKTTQGNHIVTVDPVTSDKNSYRPYIVCAVIKGIKFSDDSLKNIMKLQENLHWALGRNRKFASIGVYDLSTISKNLVYTCKGDNEISFAPLGAAGTGRENYQSPKKILETHPKGMAFAGLLANHEKYPILMDDTGTVLSMPPIINSEATRVTIDTKDVFIDVTGLDTHRISRALSIMVTSILEWDPEAVLETVSIKSSNGTTTVTPDLEPEEMTVEFDFCRNLIGVDMDDETVMDCLRKMKFDVTKQGSSCLVKIPAYRHDIIHPYDIAEDVAIGYGYKNIEAKTSEAYTIGTILPQEKKKQFIREIMIGLGFLEVLNIMLTSETRAFDMLGLPHDESRTRIANPISHEQTMVRTELMSGLLETLAHNTNNELPQKIFEVGETVYLQPGTETGTREHIFYSAAMIDSKIGFADIKSIITALTRELSVPFSVKPATKPFYMPGRACSIVIDGTEVGHAGEIHPEVLERYHLYNPVATVEIDLTLAGIAAPVHV